jgi:3-hydroxyacyl-[acyl-carrier-protein] dehydratase
MIRQSGKAYVGEELAAEAEWLCLVGEGAGKENNAGESNDDN